MSTRPPLILASTSAYRRELLERLRMPFSVVSPNVDESVIKGETPLATCTRLAMAKARAVAALNPNAVVIGSDQVAALDGVAVSKPGTHAAATAQLQSMRGRSVMFHTAVAVVHQARGWAQSDVASVEVLFRPVSDAQIQRYLKAEQPYDCAGSAKSEALGITLLEAVKSDDATALVGLPLIRLCTLLRAAGLDPLDG